MSRRTGRWTGWFATLLLLTLFSQRIGLAQPAPTQPRGGFLGIDRYDEQEDRGIFSRKNQKRADVLVIGGLLTTALWEGTDSRLGRTSWQAIDSVLGTAAVTETVKTLTQRPRPAQNPDPTQWFAGRGNKSFPSGETAMMAAFVTPYIVQYHKDTPAVWALGALPLYMGTARMASQGHWLTDVAAGAAIGAAVGYMASQRDFPLTLAWAPGHAFVGFRTKF